MATINDEGRPLKLRIAGFGLALQGPQPAMTVTEDEWRALVPSLSWQRLTGLAMAALEDDYLLLSGEQANQLVESQTGAMYHALDLERELLEVAAAFEAAGVEMTVLKGPALAHSVYPDPAWRPFGDIDVLVRTQDWQRACEVLVGCGFVARFPEPRPGFRARFGHTACHVNRAGLEFDLHRTLVAGPFGLWMDPDELFERTATFMLGDRLLRRLDDTAIFAHACIHASLGHRPPLLLPIRDVAQILTSGEVDWGRLDEWADRWRLRVVFRHALETAVQAIRCSLPPTAEAFLNGGSVGKRERRALEAYVTEKRLRGGKALTSLWAIRGITGKAAYARALVFPDRGFAEFRERKTGWASYLMRWRKPLGWLVRR
jgi:Uncharacterised nucleotidyltransferase